MSVRSLNKVLLIGNLTRDPNLRYTPSGAAVCSFGIATNRSWTPAEGGDKQERVEFHNVVAWSKLAEICGQLLHKGDKVYVEGRLQTREWKGDNNEDRRTTEVVIDNMILLRSSGPYAGQGEDDMPYDDNGNGGATANGGTPGNTSSNRAGGANSPGAGTSSNAPSTPVTDDNVSDIEDVSDDVPF